MMVQNTMEVEDTSLDEDDELMMVQMGGVFSNLPSGIFFDILSRVPIKSLSQCRWVCKTWFKIIYQPGFAELQYAKEVQIRCSPSIVVYNARKDFYLLDSQVFDDFGTSTTAIAIEMKGMDQVYSHPRFRRVFEVVGSVNGLICFSDDPQMYGKLPYYICNPITGDHITLPLSPKYKIKPLSSGFGFSTATNEYKVIRILKNGDKHCKVEAEIFTLGSHSWRNIEHFPHPFGLDQNVFLNGNLHWMTLDNMEPFHFGVIVSFNVSTEELSVIQLPPYVKQQGLSFKDLLVLGESLCFIDNDFDFQVEVWVMKSYGVATSWVKEYVIKRNNNGVNLFWYKNYEVMKLWNGELLLRRGDETLGYYDPNKRTFKPITVHEMPDVDCMIRKPIIQLGSLFSPKNIHTLRKR